MSSIYYYTRPFKGSTYIDIVLWLLILVSFSVIWIMLLIDYLRSNLSLRGFGRATALLLGTLAVIIAIMFSLGVVLGIMAKLAQ